MTRTPLLLSLIAAAALAGCNQSEPVVVGGPDDDPANQAPAANGPVELPPAIAASKTYRCKDNSIVSIDWLADGKTANLRGGPSTSSPIVGKLQPGEGIDALLDAALTYLPDRTATETKGSQVEDVPEGGGDWSPI